ncbi:MAG: 4-hydroxy-tetrahydrodipicolinate synthase [Planctomycetota bacterium]|jgi:4-hydroxy-tetrahydrodipicolinate synthase
MTALVTPFRNGDVDWPRLDALADRQINAGTDWLVPCGTTGESPTLTPSEYQRVVEAVIARASGRCPVLVGTGSNSTAEAIRRTKYAASVGADAALVVAPYYNRPTQEGLFRHFAKIAESVDLPIVLYNVPIRTGVAISNDVVVRLRETYANVEGVKHATGTVDGVTDLLSRCDITVLSGDDCLTWPMMAVGAVGVISVLGNLCPELLKSLVTVAREGNHLAALQCHQKVCRIAEGIGRVGPNPLPIKAAMAICGLLEEEFRLPLCPLDSQARVEVERVLRQHEWLEQTPV